MRSHSDCVAVDVCGDEIAGYAFPGGLLRKEGPSMRMVMQ